MLQRIKIQNFIRIGHLDLEIRSPVVFFAGPNESGKSTIAEAVRFVLLDDTPRVKLKKDYGALVTNGAKRGAVELTFDNFTVRRNIRDGKVTGDTQGLPDDTETAAICLHAKRFAEIPESARRDLILRLLRVELTVDRISEAMARRGVDAETITKFRPLLKSGLNPAHDRAKALVSERRGAWQEVTGEKWGSAKAEDWKPEAVSFEPKELSEALSDIESALAELAVERDEALQPILSKIKELSGQLAGDPPVPCPSCGTALVIEQGKLAAYTGLSESRRNTLTKMLQAQTEKRDMIRGEYAKKSSSLEADKAGINADLREAERAAGAEARAKVLHAAILEAQDLVTMLSDEAGSIASEILTNALAPFNARLAEIAAEIGWQAVSVGGDLGITRSDGHVYSLLSESAQWRADVMLHTAIAECGDFRCLIFDRMDLLEPQDRGRFVKWLSAFAGSTMGWTILTMATVKAKPDLRGLPGVALHWLQAGEIDDAMRC